MTAEPADDGIVHLTAEQAEAALRRAAFTIGDGDEAGRVIVHCRMRFTGADWGLDGALELLPTARDIAWLGSFDGHDLAVLAEDGTKYRFQANQAEHGEPQQILAARCRECGPGYRYGGDGCGHTEPAEVPAGDAPVVFGSMGPLVHLATWLVAVGDAAARGDRPPVSLPQITDAARMAWQRAGSPQPVRTRTPDRINPDGSTTCTTQRVCNGCAAKLGDVTDVEMSAALHGRPLPDVRGECPRCSPEPVLGGAS